MKCASRFITLFTNFAASRHRRNPQDGCFHAAWMIGLALILTLPGVSRADTANLTVAADTFINSALANNSAGGLGWFDAGTDGGNLGSPGVRRGLLLFDLSSIPAGSTITSATVRLTVLRVPGFGGAVNSTFDLFRLQSNWGEGAKIGNNGAAATSGEANWNARILGTANWTIPGAMSDVVESPSASAAVGSTPEQVVSWSGSGLVGDAQLWHDDPAQNHGWLLASQSENLGKTVRGFVSKEGGGDAGKLEIGYTPPAATNSLPSIAITSPANGATFSSPALVTIEASASDADGSITNVEFFSEGVSLGSAAALPYEITDEFFPGTYTLTAVAADNEGATTVSEAVIITVGTVILDDPIAERVPKGGLTIELQTVADGLAAPLGMAVPDDGSGRMFVFDQDGRIWIVTSSGLQSTPMLDVRDRLVLLGAYDERGLLGFAAHPNFAQNPLVYTYTSEPYEGTADFQNELGTANNHHAVIAEWRISEGDPNVVDSASRREVLRIDQPQSNHNGGAMHFGPDGKLYVVLGDGGSANDVAPGHVAGGNGQDINRIWGKLLRIDVDGNTSPNGQYSVPADNPFVGADGIDEIWAYGLRNVISFSFDQGTDLLYLADVGQRKVEEVNIITKGGNFGWNVKEGAFWFDAAGNIVSGPVRPVPPDLIDPIAQYDHDDGLAIIGGHVYRGSAIAALQGRYAFGDWGSFGAPSGRLFYLDEANAVKEFRIGLEDRPLGMWLRGYGEGPDGELYVFCSRQLGPSGNTGRILKLVPPPAPVSFASIAPAGGSDVTANWDGGAGPFAVQKKNSITDATWQQSQITEASSATMDASKSTGFFRVRDAAHEPPIPLSASLSGAAQRPANSSTATGLGLFSLDGNTLSFNIGYRGLSATATAAHIHGPANTSSNASPLISLAPYNGGAWGADGALSGVLVLTDAQKAAILGGQTYVNIHNANFTGGEIRGQIAPVNMQVALSGANENPAVETAGNGLGNLTLVGNQLTFNVTYQGLKSPATASHIHGPTNVNANAGVLVNLGAYNGGSYGAEGSLSGTITLTPDQLGYVIDGLTYVNFHTANHPGGEIRGQILPQATGIPLTSLLSGLAQHPPLTNSAMGAGTFSLEGSSLTFNLNYSGLSGPATGAHIHGLADTTQDEGVLISLVPFNGNGFGTSGTLSGSVALNPEQRNGLLNGMTYVNIHTAANAGGELRGQIAPVNMFASLSGHNVRSTPVDTTGRGFGSFALVRDQLTVSLTYSGLTGPASAAHIHGRASLFGTAGVLAGLDTVNGGAYGAAGSLMGTLSLNVGALLNVIDGQTYVNFHTSANSSGEIRGQIMR